jgi:hypothetical protein
VFPVAMFWGVKGEALSLFQSISAVFLYGLMVSFYVLSYIFKPVRISEIKGTSIKLSIANKDYFRDFKYLNNEIVGT